MTWTKGCAVLLGTMLLSLLTPEIRAQESNSRPIEELMGITPALPSKASVAEISQPSAELPPVVRATPIEVMVPAAAAAAVTAPVTTPPAGVQFASETEPSMAPPALPEIYFGAVPAAPAAFTPVAANPISVYVADQAPAMEDPGVIAVNWEQTEATEAADVGAAQPTEEIPAPLTMDQALGDPYGAYGPWGSFCSACCQSGFISGVEGLFLTPFGEPHQTVLLTDLVTQQTYTSSTTPGFGAGVRAWLGMQADCWGFRVVYTHFGSDFVNPVPVVCSFDNPAFINSYFLRFDTLDLELTQRFCWCRYQIFTSFGARYAHLQRSATTIGYGTLGNGVDVYGLATGANEIEGTGLTFSIGALAPLQCHCNWSWFWGFRGSLLWADSCASALTEANTVLKSGSTIAAANSRDKASASKDHSESVFIAEARLGLRYQHCLVCLPATFFMQAGLEYQHWRTGGVTAGSNSFAYLQGTSPAFGGRVDATAYAHDGSLDLIGFFVGAGLTY